MTHIHTGLSPLRIFLRILLSASAVLLIVILLGVLPYFQSSREAEGSLKERLRSVAAIAAHQFTAEEIEAIQGEKSMKTKNFETVVAKLGQVRDAMPHVRFAYIFRRTSDPMTLEFVADADSLDTPEELDVNKDGTVSEDEEGSYPGDPYDISEVPALQGEAFTGPATDEEVTTDQWGKYISGYAPIKDDDGKTVAVIGIDMSAEEYTALSLSGFPPALLFIFFFSGGAFALYIAVLAWRRFEYQRMLSTLMGNLPGVAYRSRAGLRHTMLFVSEGCRRLTGYDAEDLIARGSVSYGSLIHPKDRARVAKAIREGAEKKKSYRILYRIRTKSGREKWVLEQGEAVFSWRGKPVAFEGFITDITEQKRVDETKSQFLAAASHKLRTPLTGIRWSLEMLKQSEHQNLDIREKLLEGALLSTGHMVETLDVLLRVSALETGGIQPQLTTIPLKAAAEQAVELNRVFSEQKQLKISIDVPEDIVLRTDPSLLQEILSSLLQNAMIYTPEGGQVGILAKEEGGGVAIVVSDNGIGIPRYEQFRVFQKFFRGENALTANPNGAGLSLYLARSLTRLLGGTLSFTSKEALGTTFTAKFGKGKEGRQG